MVEVILIMKVRMTELKKKSLKKYDTKKKFKIVQESTKWEVTEYIIIQPKRRDKTECIAIKLAIKM